MSACLTGAAGALTAMAPGQGQGPPPEIDVSFDFFEVATMAASEPESPPAK